MGIQAITYMGEEPLVGRYPPFGKMGFSFGDYDAIVIAELPDNVTAAALAMAVGSTPGLSSYKTTVLLTSDEAMDAMRKASGVGYRSPSG